MEFLINSSIEQQKVYLAWFLSFNVVVFVWFFIWFVYRDLTKK